MALAILFRMRGKMQANNHLQYAITWYALAVSLGTFAFVYWRRSTLSK